MWQMANHQFEGANPVPVNADRLDFGDLCAVFGAAIHRCVDDIWCNITFNAINAECQCYATHRLIRAETGRATAQHEHTNSDGNTQYFREFTSRLLVAINDLAHRLSQAVCGNCIGIEGAYCEVQRKSR